VAPSTTTEYNLIRPDLIPVACQRIDDIHFDFDSSFIRPATSYDCQQLSLLLREHPWAPLSIFGHADPVGQDDYNKKLSGRRARALYALLVRDLDIWEDLFSNPHGSDNWGTLRVQELLAMAGYDPGPLDGIKGDLTTEAVKAFQTDHGLDIDGKAGKNTRKELFKIYMDLLCVNWRGESYVLDKKQFLARGRDANGKGDYQGCGEYNPELVFSKSEAKEYEYDKTMRDAENQPNRRAVIYLFYPYSVVTPELWPCPNYKGEGYKCKARFWSDGDERRSNQELRRKYENTHDTYACRFYDRIRHSLGKFDDRAPEINEFFGRPASHDTHPDKPHMLLVPQGSPIILHWQVAGAERIWIEAMTNDGRYRKFQMEINPRPEPLEPVNQIQVTPNEDFTYTLFASNKSGVTQHYRQVLLMLYPAQSLPLMLYSSADRMELLPNSSPAEETTL
jgi:hypothetical protein